MFTRKVDAAKLEQRLVRIIRFFPLVTLALLFLAYLLGGFSERANPLLPRDFIQLALILYIAIVPTAIIFVFIIADILRTRASAKKRKSPKKLSITDPFDLPNQEMHGFKIVYITGRDPIFTGLTGDQYTSDDVAACSLNSEHIPPVADCECGFYIFKDLQDAKYELSINPGAFLVDADLFGIGFEYSRGFKAEAQRVNSMSLPRRCMRCKTLPPQRFVTTYKLGLNSFGHWSWELRCSICSSTFKDEDCLTPNQMANALKIAIN